MTASGTAVRPGWEQLPALLRDGLAARLGAIEAADVQTGGFTPGLAARLRLHGGDRVFVKGIAADHPLADRYRAEARVMAALPAAAPAPALRWHGEIAGWIVLTIDDADGHHADLAPDSPDVPRVVETVASLADVLTPCPVEAPAAGADLAGFVHGWRELAASPPAERLDGWAARNLQRLAAAETQWLADADGPTLLHGDINRSNLLVGDRGIALVDWGQPICGAAWIDIADLIPHLILAGHTPDSAETTVAPALAATGVDTDAVTGYAAAFAGYWARSSRLPAPPGVPHLRAHQARAAAAALAWTAHRTQWP